ncbi:MAG TPA: hypothetical protein VE973_01555 [Candidatus Limnocylindria bacterium]|nr:hypothetical protein [Candidatus Limnocylindria bacterium]
MKQKTYMQTVTVIFIAVAALHGLRLLNGWQLKIGDTVIPLWVSWLGMPVALFLAYTAVKFTDKK